MGYPGLQRKARGVWALAREQDDVVSREQLLALGFHPQAIKHRVARGRLHPLWPGVYALGSPNLTARARWRAATMACGPAAWLSHATAAALFGIRDQNAGPIEVSVPAHVARRLSGIRVHRRRNLHEHVGKHDGLAVTSPALTFVDLAARLPPGEVEAALKEADVRDLIGPIELRRQVDGMSRRPGLGVLRRILDRHTLLLTDSELERLFVPIARSAGLPSPLTREWVNGFRVDFVWPDLGLVVETDGLRYHRTPAQQARDRVRDQVHSAAGLTPLRFTHAQVKFDQAHVQHTLEAVARRLRGVR